MAALASITHGPTLMRSVDTVAYMYITLSQI